MGRIIAMIILSAGAFLLARDSLTIVKLKFVSPVQKVVSLKFNKVVSMVTGLLPPCDPSNIRSVGNAAGCGAYMALLSIKKREEAERIARWVKHIELALDPDFQNEFIKAIPLPPMNE